MYCNLWIHISSYQKTVLWVNIASYEVLMLLLNPHFDYKLCWMLWINLFFSTWVFFHGHWRLIGRHGTLPFFIPLYHFHLFANIQTFVCTFGCEMTNRTACIYQTATRWDLPPLSNYHLTYWWCEVSFCLFTWWFDTSFLLQQSWYRKPVDSNLHRLSPLYYERTD